MFFFHILGGPIIMASNELQQLRSKQQFKRNTQLSQPIHNELKCRSGNQRNSSSGQQLNQTKRETEYALTRGNFANRLSFGGPHHHLRFNSLAIWCQVLLILCLCSHEVFCEGNVGE